MPIPIVLVDAFASQPFGGNPAAVCLLDGPRDRGWMQAVAAEMAQSETAFVRRLADGWSLRWFTPLVEVGLCGHATLAVAHVLWERGSVAAGEPVRFETASGRIGAARLADGWIELDLPAHPFPSDPRPAEATVASVLAGLSVAPACLVEARARGDDLLLVLSDAAAVRAARLDARALVAVANEVTLTAPADGRDAGPAAAADIVSRVFVPREGIDEDPVTGSAHAALGPYWTARLGRPGLLAYQASRRGGLLRVRAAVDRVLVAGAAVTVLDGELRV
ncbi:MAG TPA: PhzF family phenazine biosynthesis protein [Candidatus Limnocylindrales bacterium]